MATSRARSTHRRGISRIDQPSTRTFGWFVRLGWHVRRDGSYGPKHTKFFGDAGNGGKQKALKAAQSFVAKVEKKAPKRAVARKSAAKKKVTRKARKRA
jgi:hypothetical protein